MGHILINDLRNARKSAGCSRVALATRIGVPPQAIKRLENGVGSVALVDAVMKALNFNLVGLGRGSCLAKQLRASRIARGISVTTLASKTGLSRTTIAGLESGGGTVASLLRALAVVAPNARRRAPERSYWGQADKEDRDSRFTPPEFLAMLHEAFGEIDLDPCGHAMSPVVAGRRILLAEGGNGLIEAWSGRLAFVNPPYSELLTWLKRAHEQWLTGNVQTVVCLIPVRTDSAWFHETLSAVADMYFLQGRVQFLDPRGKRQPTPFSLMLLTLGATAEQKQQFARLAPGFWINRESAAAAVPGNDQLSEATLDFAEEDRLFAELRAAPPRFDDELTSMQVKRRSKSSARIASSSRVDRS